MKKAYVTPEVIVHGTVEDMTKGSLVTEIWGYHCRQSGKCGGNGGSNSGGNGGVNGGGDGS